MSDEPISFLLFSEAVPTLGTAIGVATVQYFGTGGNPVTIAEVACFSILGRELTIHNHHQFELSRGLSYKEELKLHCDRHVRDTYNSLLVNNCPGQFALPIPFQKADDILEFLNRFTKIGIGNVQLRTLCDSRRHLNMVVSDCINHRYTPIWREPSI
jgi:hypothetical protein